MPRSGTPSTAEELYARRFLILFSDYRKLDDIMEDKTFSKRLATLERCDEIDETMKIIANNIQAIHNSLASAAPENPLVSTTELVQDEFCQRERNDAEQTANEEYLQRLMGSYLATSSDAHAPLMEDAKTFTPHLTKAVSSSKIGSATMSGHTFKSVFGDNEDNQSPATAQATSDGQRLRH